MSEPTILNPRVYLNYLSPEVGAEYEVFRDVHLVALGAYIWDMLSSSSQEVKMMRASRSGPIVSIIAYWIARIFGLITTVLSVLGKISPVDYCQGLLLSENATYLITSAASSFLFLRRVHAVFFDNKVARCFFTALWLTNVVVLCLVPMGGTAEEIADTKHCISTGYPPYLAAAYIVPFVYDSLVFLAVSYKINASYSLHQTPLHWKTFFSRPLPRLSKCILQGGQQYYLVSVCANIVTSLLLLVHSMPFAYRLVPLLPTLVLTSSMACRVFRNLFLQDIPFEEESGQHQCPVCTTKFRGSNSSDAAHAATI